jgi:hypothetical protein
LAVPRKVLVAIAVVVIVVAGLAAYFSTLPQLLGSHQ